jgi:hypothetical protein
MDEEQGRYMPVNPANGSHAMVHPPLVLAFTAALLMTSSPAFADARATANSQEKESRQNMPGWMVRGIPGEGHKLLEPLIGQFRQHKEIHGTLGRAPNAPPIKSDAVVTTRSWVAGGRAIEDISEGKIEGMPYWRKGWLGYSAMDQRYEWVTIDAINTTMMIYVGAQGSGAKSPIEMSGSFTDQGVVSEETVGKRVRMRTVITIESNDRHVFELYFTPPGGGEVLADRTVYERLN